MPEFLTIEDVCRLLKLSNGTVYDLCRHGRLPGAAKVGGQRRVNASDLNVWLKAGGASGTQPPDKEDR